MDSENEDFKRDYSGIQADFNQMIEKAWAIEIKRRSEELKNGLVRSLAWSEVRSQTRKKMTNTKYNHDQETH